MAKKGGLGKGLDALFAENTVTTDTPVSVLRLSDIVPNRDQPRKQFDEEALAELADSIAQHGVLQPLLVRPMTDGTYCLVAGERRWRAARLAGLSEVPVVIREMDDREMAELALIENLQREDLNPMEEARGYQTLMDSYGLTQEEAARVVNKSRPAVAHALRLLRLPPAVGDMEARLSCMDTMRELFRQFMSFLILERTRLEQDCIYLDERISFNEMNEYFFSGCACAFFQIAVDTYTDMRYKEEEWNE